MSSNLVLHETDLLGGSKRGQRNRKKLPSIFSFYAAVEKSLSLLSDFTLSLSFSYASRFRHRAGIFSPMSMYSKWGSGSSVTAGTVGGEGLQEDHVDDEVPSRG